MKEESWKQFVSMYSNLDPRGVVYRVCRGKNVRKCLASLNVNGVNYVMWKECANVMMERFFPATSMVEEAS